jgi:putative ABC transport system ATP-binding protein
MMKITSATIRTTTIANSHTMTFPMRRPMVLDPAIERLRNCSSLRSEQQMPCPVRAGARRHAHGFIMLHSRTRDRPCPRRHEYAWWRRRHAHPTTIELMTDVPLVLADGIVRRDPLRGQTLLQPTTFALDAGDRMAITGPSGSGKSVFLRALALLDPLDAGRVVWHGAAVERAAIPRYRRNVAYIRQRPALLDGTVEDNLRYPFELRAYRDVRFDRARAASLVAQAGRADDFLDKLASELSGGEAQITALIRVLQLAPEVLLLDEPTASLDPDSTRAIEALVHAWFDAQPERHASVWVSHDRAQAARMSKRHLTMRAGVLDEAAQIASVHQEHGQ